MREPGIKAPGSIAPASESQESALSIHNQIIAAGGYPKSTQVVQQMLRKPEHPNHPTDINKNVLDFLLKKEILSRPCEVLTSKSKIGKSLD